MAVSKETLYIIIFNIVNSLFFSLQIIFFNIYPEKKNLIFFFSCLG